MEIMQVDIYLENDEYYYALVSSEKEFLERLSAAKEKGFLRTDSTTDKSVWINVNKISSFVIKR